MKKTLIILVSLVATLSLNAQQKAGPNVVIILFDMEIQNLMG
jgi:hypothetical protein